MPTAAHEIAISRIRDKPPLLSGLATVATHSPPAANRIPGDTAVSLANPADVRPDILLANGKRGLWDAIEVQLGIDPCKARSWPLLASILHAKRKAMGDIWVITTVPSVARWAEQGFHILAAWSVHRRYGTLARGIVERAGAARPKQAA